jgi:hypothetical protein
MTLTKIKFRKFSGYLAKKLQKLAEIPPNVVYLVYF